MTLTNLNRLPKQEAEDALSTCCGSTAWAQRMAALRPYESEKALFALAQVVWLELSSSDWLEAFSHHPKIGSKTNSEWAAQEQSGVKSASGNVLKELAEGNAIYEKRFGHVFLVCATGKSGDEMLELLKKRLSNPPKDELLIAAQEQSKITKIRLEKLLRS